MVSSVQAVTQKRKKTLLSKKKLSPEISSSDSALKSKRRTDDSDSLPVASVQVGKREKEKNSAKE